ncbi:gp057 [Rhodococcus phage ReqiDocB7]|uniref:gp057 n=1 Tax=Rhodococcus phage ReqiDocB7 TaxID=691966 RepID=UPI0001CDD852|nr:gp057 [Rhodococcus phage ReqiDocB7]ADD80843.1 gp057 [Rhodococcus phage ReqiDocB7]
MPWIPNPYDKYLSKAYNCYVEVNKKDALEIIQALTTYYINIGNCSFGTSSIAKGQKRKIWLSNTTYRVVARLKGAEWMKANVKYTEAAVFGTPEWSNT